MVRIAFDRCDVTIDDEARYIETVFRDGTIAPAQPNSEPSDVQRARDLGYGGDTWLMTRAHEIIHTWVAERMGETYSVILWNVAHGHGNRWPPGGREEEGYVTSFQRYLNTGEADDLVFGFFDRAGLLTGLSREELVDQARSLLQAE